MAFRGPISQCTNDAPPPKTPQSCSTKIVKTSKTNFHPNQSNGNYGQTSFTYLAKFKSPSAQFTKPTIDKTNFCKERPYRISWKSDIRFSRRIYVTDRRYFHTALLLFVFRKLRLQFQFHSRCICLHKRPTALIMWREKVGVSSSCCSTSTRPPSLLHVELFLTSSRLA